jgi:hypothetical protein
MELMLGPQIMKLPKVLDLGVGGACGAWRARCGM